MKKELIVVKLPHFDYQQMGVEGLTKLTEVIQSSFGEEIKPLIVATDEVDYVTIELLRGEYSEEEIITKEKEIRKICSEYVKPKEEEIIYDDKQEISLLKWIGNVTLGVMAGIGILYTIKIILEQIIK